jgi:hypothetical protein
VITLQLITAQFTPVHIHKEEAIDFANGQDPNEMGNNELTQGKKESKRPMYLKQVS